jgi:hypothetical protein
MEQHFDNLRKEVVNTDHWAPIEAPAEVNRLVGDFLLSAIQLAPVKASL